MVGIPVLCSPETKFATESCGCTMPAKYSFPITSDADDPMVVQQFAHGHGMVRPLFTQFPDHSLVAVG